MAFRSRVKRTAKNIVRGAARQVLKTLDLGSDDGAQTTSSRDFGLDQAPGGEVPRAVVTGAKPSPRVEAERRASPKAVPATAEVSEALEGQPIKESKAALKEAPSATVEAVEGQPAEDVKALQGGLLAAATAQLAPAEPLSESEREGMRESIVAMIQTVHDPEISVNIYELGLIYEINVADSGDVVVKMTLTSANCPAAQSLPGEVEVKTASVEKVRSVAVDLVWDPPWDSSMMSEGAQLELNMF